MRKKFVLNLILLVFLNLLIKPFYILGIDTEILTRVGQETYGLYFALLNLSFLLNIFLDLGIVNFNTANIARYDHLLTKHFAGIAGIRFLLALGYLLISLLVAIFLGYRGASFNLLIPICFNQILAGSILYFRSNLAGMHLFVQDSLISVMDRLLLIVLCAAVLWGQFTGMEMTIELFIYFQMLAYGITFFAAFFAVRRHVSNFRPTIRKIFTLAILKKSFPYALLILLMSFYYRTDGIMLERMLENGAYEAGIYAQAFRFFEAGNMVAYLFAALILPMFSRLQGQNEKIHDLMMLSFKLIFTGSVIFGLAAFQYSKEIMELRFDSEIGKAAATFRLLMISFIAVCGTYIFGTLLTANGNLRQLNILAVTAGVVNVVLNLILIPSKQAEGAALASAITQIGVLIGQIIIVRRIFNFNRLPIDIAKMLLLPLLCLVSLHYISNLSLNWMMQLVSYLLVAAVLAFVTKMFRTEDAKSLWTAFRRTRTSAIEGT